MGEDLEARLGHLAAHRSVSPGSVAAAELGTRAEDLNRHLADLEHNLLRASAAFDGELDNQAAFNALDYLLECLARVEQAAASLCVDLERATGRARPTPAGGTASSTSGVLDAAAERLTQWCAARVPEHAKSEVRLDVRRRGLTLTIVERRPPWTGAPGEWTAMPIAQFRLASDAWTLWWADRNGRWHEYVDGPATDNFERQLQEVADDPTHVFWG